MNRLRLKPAKNKFTKTCEGLLPKIERMRQLTLKKATQDRQELKALADGLQDSSEEEDEPHYEQERDKFVGEDAVSRFYSKYKNLDKIIRLNEFYQTPNSSIVSILKDRQARGIIPKRMGIVKPSGEEGVLALQNMGYGNRNLSNLAQALPTFEVALQEVRISNNNLDEEGVKDFLNSITGFRPKVLDLSSNQVRLASCQSLKKLLKNRNPLIELNLEGTQLTVLGLEAIMYADSSIQKLNLSRNNLTDESLLPISRMVAGCQVNELYLHWNKIQTSRYNELFWKALAESELAVLDLSYNNLGADGALGVCYLLDKSKLKHLDLSANRFSLEDCCAIAECLKMNHQVMGFHFEGNYGYVSDGYLVVDSLAKKECVLHKRINEPGHHPDSACWLCGCYAEVQILWRRAVLPGLKIHLEKNRFRPVEMTNEDGEQSLTAVLSQGQVYFFFSLYGKEFISEDFQTCEVTPYLAQSLRPFPFLLQGRRLNYVTARRTAPLIDQTYSNNTKFRPRSQAITYSAEPFDFRRWTIADSIFVNQSRIEEAVQAGLQAIKGLKTLREDDNAKIRQLVAKHYAKLVAIYLRLSCNSHYNEGFCIQPPIMMDFLTSCGCLDGKTLSAGDVESKIMIVNSLRERQGLKSNFSTRSQFIQLLVRLAEDKFVKNGNLSCTSDAFERLLNDHLLRVDYDYAVFHSGWRRERLFNYECDVVFRHYSALLGQIFFCYATEEKSRHRLTFDSFREIVLKSGLKKLTFQELNECFLLSMRIDPREGSPRLSYGEFIEAIGRLAERTIASSQVLARYATRKTQKMATKLKTRASTIKLAKVEKEPPKKDMKKKKKNSIKAKGEQSKAETQEQPKPKPEDEEKEKTGEQVGQGVKFYEGKSLNSSRYETACRLSVKLLQLLEQIKFKFLGEEARLIEPFPYPLGVRDSPTEAQLFDF